MGEAPHLQGWKPPPEIPGSVFYFAGAGALKGNPTGFQKPLALIRPFAVFLGGGYVTER